MLYFLEILVIFLFLKSVWQQPCWWNLWKCTVGWNRKSEGVELRAFAVHFPRSRMSGHSLTLHVHLWGGALELRGGVFVSGTYFSECISCPLWVYQGGSPICQDLHLLRTVGEEDPEDDARRVECLHQCCQLNCGSVLVGSCEFFPDTWARLTSQKANHPSSCN